jgi:hypothetical protein
LVSVNIDISDFVNKWQLTIAQQDLFVYTVLDQLSFRFAEEWRAMAGQELKQTRQEYQQSIYVEKIDNQNVVVGLKGFLPNAVEQGLSAFDQKEGFERSAKKKQKKDGGWYLTIPFRFATPTALAESSIFSQILPQQVYQVAKQILINNQVQLTVSQLPGQYQQLKVRPEVMDRMGNSYDPYQHKSPIFAGLQRVEGGSEATSHGQYVSFRRVSDLSDPNAWIHTGIEAYNLADKALQNFDIASIIADVKVKFINN